MSVKIIIDSTCDLLPETKARFSVVPLTVRFGEREYRDGVDIDHREFYRMLTTGQEMPTTSQASPADFEQVYRDCTADGSQAVVLCVSGKLSGTYQSAVIAAQDYEGQVFVVDSRSVAIGTGILAELALRLRDSGMSAADIATRLEEERARVRVIALLDTLEYLKRGGRI
ncbi:MAG: DegV family protein, partial [Clostridia bacterium]|nr:DegV family protein [Clostridia bacterium]